MNNIEQELQELLSYFETAKLPDINKFIESEAHSVRAYKGSEIVHEYLLKHLRELKELITSP